MPELGWLQLHTLWAGAAGPSAALAPTQNGLMWFLDRVHLMVTWHQDKWIRFVRESFYPS